jgi:hypothetical protein
VAPPYRDSTALHESAHAVVSHVLGEEIQYLELQGDRDGIAMPFHSPCPLCQSAVAAMQACVTCLEYYEKNDPASDGQSRRIERRYRVEAAVAAAGEIAEMKFGNGAVLATNEELEWDRDRVRTRSSLRHLWQRDACSSYRSNKSDCTTCAAGANLLLDNVRNLVNRTSVWAGTQILAEQLKVQARIDGRDVRRILEEAGVDFESEDVDRLWPPL